MAMLWGADSWLSRVIWNAAPAGAVIDAVENLRSLATTTIASPAGADAAGADAAGADAAGLAVVPPDPPEQAAATAARATRPRLRTRRFIGSVLLVGRAAGIAPGRAFSSDAGTLGAAAGDESGEGRQLALDHGDGVAVHPGEVDGDQDDQGDFDGLGDVGRLVVRALDRPAEDGRQSVGDKAETHDPAEPDREGERDDHRDRGDEVADRVQREQESAQGGVDVTGRQGQADDGGADDDVGGAELRSGSEHRVSGPRYVGDRSGVPCRADIVPAGTGRTRPTRDTSRPGHSSPPLCRRRSTFASAG